MDKKKVDKKKVVILLWLAFSISLTVVMMATVMYAFFFNDGIFSVSINGYGEALVEVVLMPVLLIMGIVSLHWYYQDLKPGGTQT